MDDPDLLHSFSSHSGPPSSSSFTSSQRLSAPKTPVSESGFEETDAERRARRVRKREKKERKRQRETERAAYAAAMTGGKD